MIRSQDKIVYLSHTEYRLLSQMYDLCKEGIYYSHYNKFFENVDERKIGYNWTIYTCNAYYDLTVIKWCNLFGSYKEPTHYRMLSSTEDLKESLTKLKVTKPFRSKLKISLLSNIKLDINKYDIYHRKALKYRNKNLIHRENSPLKIKNHEISYPNIDVMMKSFKWLYFFIVDILETFPNEMNAKNCYKFQYKWIKHEKFDEIVNEDMPNFFIK